MPLIVDAHEDLAWNAQTFGRDYTRSALETRAREAGGLPVQKNGDSVLGLPEYLRGQIAVIFTVLFVSPAKAGMGDWDTLTYANANEAHQKYAAQLDYYERLVGENEQFQFIRARADLERVLASWDGPDERARRVGLVQLMEGADCVREPKEVEWWRERGVRIIGPAWGATRYAGGTGQPGPLTADGRRLLKEMADQQIMLDLTHLSDEGCLQALDSFEGVLLASHANPRALAPEYPQPERMLTDEMIRRLGERGGVLGLVPYNRFMTGTWRKRDPKAAVGLSRLVELVDHVCQLTGSSAHVGLGTDFDGGFGQQHIPAELDTVADLQKLDGFLAARGYSEADRVNVLSGNWLALLRRGLPA